MEKLTFKAFRNPELELRKKTKKSYIKIGNSIFTEDNKNK